MTPTPVDAHSGTPAPAASEYVSVLRRRRRIVVPTLVVLPLAALVFSLGREPLYAGSAEVLLSRTNLAAALAGVQDSGATVQSDRFAATQAELARAPAILERTLAAAGLGDQSAEDLLDSSSVSAKSNADLLEFEVRDGDRSLASSLAGEYARQFTIFTHRLETEGIGRARQAVRDRIAQLKAAGATGGAVYTSLVATEQRLTTMEALGTSNAFVVRSAGQAEQIAPRPKRAFLLGLGLGIVLAVGLAFLWESLDTRVRSGSEVWQRLGLPLLARLPSGRRPAGAPPGVAMLVNPHGNVAEAFRVLRANVDLVNVDRGAAVIMVTSAFEREGRSEVTANLAVAFARAGRHVVLVDLDLRRPSLAGVFGLSPEPGLTEVAFGTARRSRALAEIPLGGAAGNGGASGNGASGSEGKLEVLVAGRTSVERSEFVGTHAVAELLAALRRDSDLVLLDAPPMLSGGDAIALGARADALIAVVRLNDLRRATLDELGRVLESIPAAKLGVVVTEADDELPPEQRSALPNARTRQALAVWQRVAEAAAAASAKKRVR